MGALRRRVAAAVLVGLLAPGGPAAAAAQGQAPTSAQAPAPTSAHGQARTSAQAPARTSAQAREQVAEGAAGVAALERRVRTAIARFDAARDALAAGTAQAIVIGEQADAATLAARAAQVERVGRVRALYMAGGPAVLYVGLLDARSPHELLARAKAAERVLAADERDLDTAARAAERATGRADTARWAARARTVTAREVQARWEEVRALLDRARARLADLSERADRLAAAERLAAARAAAALRAAELAASRAVPAGAGVTVATVPAEFAALYRSAAATCPGLAWSVLSAIGQVESGHGRNPGISVAGAMGPMQFMPATFAAYGVDGGGDGRIDIMDPADAIFSAARYLCATGAGMPQRLPGAIWHYNHAQWYVDLVLRLAALIDPGSVPT